MMGQYHRVFNIDKKQYLHPHDCGDGLKLMEFGRSGNGTMACLAILLADSNGRGGGDFQSKSNVVGSWAGDRVVISGDYADEGKYEFTRSLYEESDKWDNISSECMEALKDDER